MDKEKEKEFEIDFEYIKGKNSQIKEPTICALTPEAVKLYMEATDKGEMLKKFHVSFARYFNVFKNNMGPDKCANCYASKQCEGNIHNPRRCLSRLLNWILWKPGRNKPNGNIKKKIRESRDIFDETQMQTIYRWEHGSSTSLPYIDTLKALSLIFSCTIDDLLSGNRVEWGSRNKGFDVEQMQGNYLIYHCPPNKDMNIGALHVYPFGKELRAKYLIKIERDKILDFFNLGSEFFKTAKDEMLYEGELIFYRNNIYLQFNACDNADKLYGVLLDTYQLQENIAEELGSVNIFKHCLGGCGVFTTLKMNSAYEKEPFAYPVCLSRTRLSEEDESQMKNTILSNNGTKIAREQGIDFVKMLVGNYIKSEK